jgi:hypothetical protein
MIVDGHLGVALDLQRPARRHGPLKKTAVWSQILPTVGALANGAALLCTQWHQIRYIGGPNSTANAEKDLAE